MYSSVSGVIFFSGFSSSANSCLYFSQLDPVALGMMLTCGCNVFEKGRMCDVFKLLNSAWRWRKMNEN